MKTARQIGKEIAEGSLDPVELVESTLETINADPNRDQIYARTTAERARSEAKSARDRQKSDSLKSPLDGVPISWKDLFDTAGIATESGSKLLAGRVPLNDCTAIANSSDAGLVCIGKTHLSELAFSGLGINPSTATSPNVHGSHLAPGGSSSGAAASVAHGHVPIGIGSDTGGSVRIPSAWNDLVGFKTTHGLISGEGIVPLCSGFDTAGPLCTSVADAWLMVAVMAGLPLELPEAKPAANCRFLINQTTMLDGLHQNQKAGFEEAIETLRSTGATVDVGPIPECDDLLPLGPILFPYEAWREWGEKIEAQPDLMFEPVRNRFMSGMDLTHEDYQLAWSKMLAARESYNNRTAEYDAVLAPTVAIGPPEVEPLLVDFELFSATNMLALRNTRFFNMLGNCVLTLPTTRPASGLMIAAQGGQDRDLASIGLGLEQILFGTSKL